MARLTTECYGLIADRDAVDERWRRVARACAFLKSYQDSFHKIERCPSVGALMAERALEAKLHARVSAKCALDTLNEANDVGRVYQAVRNLAAVISEGEKRVFFDVRRESRALFEKHFSHVDSASFFDQAAELVKRYRIAVAPHSDGILASFKEASGREHQHVIRDHVRAGDLCRVSSKVFFAPGGAQLAGGSAGILNVDDCHHRPRDKSVSKVAGSYDPYSVLVSAMCMPRELMYRHVLEVAERGPAQVAGNDFASIGTIIIILTVAAAAAAAAGAVIEIGCATGAWSGNVRFWGGGTPYRGCDFWIDRVVPGKQRLRGDYSRAWREGLDFRAGKSSTTVAARS